MGAGRKKNKELSRHWRGFSLPSAAGREPAGIVFNIQHYSIHDGPGIRTVVFLKGCPLSCGWCCNPESMSPKPEVAFRAALCNGCGECVDACPEKAITVEEEKRLVIDRRVCLGCGTCGRSCARRALTVYGERMTVSQVLDRVLADAPFYRRSGGGVTVSGGEPCSHPRFLRAILKGCREAGVRTAIETSGCVGEATFRRILREVDLVLFDLKVVDPASHKRFTGRRNDMILRNARFLASEARAVQVRMPLVPGVNEGGDDLKALASFLRDVGLSSIELMPYHQFAKAKYASLGRPYLMGDLRSANEEDGARACRILEAEGIACSVSV